VFQKWDFAFRIPQFSLPNTALSTYHDAERFQFNITFNQRLFVNQIAIPIDHENLNFHYQPELTEEEIAEGHYRPENMVGSYAVYSNHRNNEYGTGKVMHIYRPLFIDAEGKESWVDLEVTENSLILTANSTFLATAAYPIVLDPIFGYDTIGGTGITGAGFCNLSEYDLDEDGTITHITAYITNFNAGIQNVSVACYDGTSREIEGHDECSVSGGSSE